MGGNIGIMGLYRDNGKENGNYIQYIGVIFTEPSHVQASESSRGK